MKKLGISQWLLIYSLFINVLVIFSGLFFVDSIRNLTGEMFESSKNSFTSSENSYSVLDLISQQEIDLQLLLRERDPDVIEVKLNALNTRENKVKDAIKNCGSKCEKILAKYNENQLFQQRVIDSFLKGDVAVALEQASQGVTIHSVSLHAEMKTNSQQKLDLDRLELSKGEKKIENFISTTVFTLGCIVGVFALSCFLMWRFIMKKVGEMGEVSKELLHSSENLSELSSVLLTSSQRVASTSIQQLKSVQETVTTFLTVRESVSVTGERISEMSRSAGEVASLSEQGSKLMQNMVGAIENIKVGSSQMEDVSDTIGQICEKTQVINDIVFKTQLLSFNASIEAARAGAHGRGFSVVAEEVGNLAHLSGKASTEISNLLTASKQRVSKIVLENYSNTEQGVKLSNETSDAIQQTTLRIRKTLDDIFTINGSLKKQQEDLEDISVGLRGISKATKANQDVSQELAGSSQDVKNGASNLSNLAKVLNNILHGM